MYVASTFLWQTSFELSVVMLWFIVLSLSVHVVQGLKISDNDEAAEHKCDVRIKSLVSYTRLPC